MLIKKLSETDQFTTDFASTVTVGSLLPHSAANDSPKDRNSVHARRLRRQRRNASQGPSNLGGWKLRMW